MRGRLPEITSRNCTTHVYISDGYTTVCSYALVGTMCLRFCKGVCYSVLHAVTGSVRCLLCPLITDKTSHQLLTYYHLNHKIVCMFSPGMGTGVLVYILPYTKINSVVLHQLCIVIVLHRIFKFKFGIVAIYFHCCIYNVIM